MDIIEAMTIVLEIAKVNTIPAIITDPTFVIQRDKQIKACDMVQDFIVREQHNYNRGYADGRAK